MDKTTVIILVVVVLLVVGVIMYQSSVQAQRDRELALQLQQIHQVPEAIHYLDIG